MAKKDTLESLSARVRALEEFVTDMAEVSATMKQLARQQAKDLETAFSAYADQISARCATLGSRQEGAN